MGKLKANRAEMERKQALLSERAGQSAEDHLSRLLVSYAGGSQRRTEVADNIVAEFRPVLRANGPNFDGPLYARIIAALEAAEAFGRTGD